VPLILLWSISSSCCVRSFEQEKSTSAQIINALHWLILFVNIVGYDLLLELRSSIGILILSEVNGQVHVVSQREIGMKFFLREEDWVGRGSIDFAIIEYFYIKNKFYLY